jgi:hypothetical protein
MATHALFLTAASITVLLILLMGQLAFLAPYRSLLLHNYVASFGLFFVVLAVNLFAAFYSATRVLFLKDTGSKLAHLEKQLRSDSALASELSRRLGA